MSRYRSIAVRFWNDEDIAELDALDRLTFLYLMTSPYSTPVGIMVIPPSALVDAIMPSPRQVAAWLEEGMGDQRLITGHMDPTDLIDKGFRERLAERSLEHLRNVDLIWQKRSLFVVPRYLEFNKPDNPNVLRSWLHAVEELPRSELYVRLRDHLRERGNLRDWMFDLLLNPLADGEHTRLSHTFRSRWEAYKKRSGKGSGKRRRKGSKKPSPIGTGKGIGEGTPKQDQDQEQDQDPTAAKSSSRRVAAASVHWKEQHGRFEGIKEGLMEEWREAYPGLNIAAKIKHIEQWLRVNPDKRYKNYGRFLVNWFNKDHSELLERRGVAGPDRAVDKKVEAALRGEEPMTQEVLDLLGGSAYFEKSEKK